MQKDSKNKMIDGAGIKDKAAEVRTEQEYHFAGGLEYEPLTVKAASREEAEKLWQEKRKKVEPINNQ